MNSFFDSLQDPLTFNYDVFGWFIHLPYDDARVETTARD